MKRYLDTLTNLVLYLGVFIGSIFVATDPDLGWHLKYGEYFFRHGKILRNNTFSELMPNYHWNNSSWATDLLSYFTYHHAGFIGLTLLGALVITLTFFFISKAAKLSTFEKSLIFPTVLFLVNQVNAVSFRGQLLSLLLLGILYYMLSVYDEKKGKTILLLVPLFIIWSNFHGEYIVGIATLLIWTLTYSFKEIFINHKRSVKSFFKENKKLLLSVSLSVFAVMINPFGAGVYLETLHHFGDPAVKFVTEYIPFVSFSQVWWNLVIAGTICIVGAVLMGTSKKGVDSSPFTVISLILFILSLWIRRYAWTFYYSAVFLFKPVAHFFQPDDKKAITLGAFVISVIFLVGTIWSKTPFDQFLNRDWITYCQKSVIACSPNAAQTIIDNHLEGKNLLTMYDYGGWLIWNYPQIKPTIDGRMHLWKDELGFSGFRYYFAIEQNNVDIDSTPYSVVLTSHKKPIYRELLALSKQGEWKTLYDDDLSAVFVKNQ